jgi:hypothetical protein
MFVRCDDAMSWCMHSGTANHEGPAFSFLHGRAALVADAHVIFLLQHAWLISLSRQKRIREAQWLESHPP